MLEWTEAATLPAVQGGPVWMASAKSDDGAELTVAVWGERPGVRRRLVLAANPKGPGPAVWELRTKGRPPTSFELVEAARVAAQGSPEWWAVLYPFRTDIEFPEGLEEYVTGGYLMGPVPEGAGMLVQLALGQVPQANGGPRA